MTITLTIILFSIVANATFTNSIKQITDKIDISVFLKDAVTTEQRDKIIRDLRSNPDISSVEFVTKEQALEAYKQASANNPELLSAISQTDNPLPASIKIKPADPNKIDEIQAFVSTEEIKQLSERTDTQEERMSAVNKITAATNFFQQAGLAGVVLFAIVSMLIIFNTIRMTIFNRRDELQIMRLLGASTTFIRGPFIVETILYGIVAAIISVSLCDTLFRIATSSLEASTLGLLDIAYAGDFFAQHFWTILTVQLLIGMLIGAASSTIATRRYLKFKTSK